MVRRAAISSSRTGVSARRCGRWRTVGRSYTFRSGATHTSTPPAGAGVELPASSRPGAIADAIARPLAEPTFRDGAREAAESIARAQPDRTAGEALGRLAGQLA
jgi:hypothetical protein